MRSTNIFFSVGGSFQAAGIWTSGSGIPSGNFQDITFCFFFPFYLLFCSSVNPFFRVNRIVSLFVANDAVTNSYSTLYL